MESTTSQRISGRATNGTAPRAAVFNENEVRAAAGLTMVIGAVAFSYAYFDQYYLPLRIVTAVLLRRVPRPARRSVSGTARWASSRAR